MLTLGNRATPQLRRLLTRIATWERPSPEPPRPPRPTMDFTIVRNSCISFRFDRI